VKASDPHFNHLMEVAGVSLNLKMHAVSSDKIPIVGPGKESLIISRLRA